VDDVAFLLRDDQEFLSHAGLFPDEHRLTLNGFPSLASGVVRLGSENQQLPTFVVLPAARLPTAHQQLGNGFLPAEHQALLPHRST